MNLTVIVPSRQSLSQAGVRIRYDRIARQLKQSGWHLSLQPIDELARFNDLSAGVVLFSKCQDARSLLLAQMAREAGYTVGVDLFDDYFSQSSDARFQHLRRWFAEMAEVVDFYLCSTERMAQAAARYMAAKPGQVLSDPADEFDHGQLSDELCRKRADALLNRRLKVLWFGIGDNPSFPVGLDDLAAQAEQLRALEQHGFDVQLTVLTNERSLNIHGLGQLRRLGVPTEVKIWSIESEQSALADHFVSFLPVNSQPFSVAKSLNRGITALAGGTQLLSAGYPLYAPLSAYLYRASGELVADLFNDKLKLRGATLEALAATLADVASPEREAAALAGFLETIGSPSIAVRNGSPAKKKEVRSALLHGFQPNPASHHFAQKMGWLSLATPLTPAGIEFDAHLGFFGRERIPALRLSKLAKSFLPPEIRRRARSAPAALGKGGPVILPLEYLDLEPGLDWLGDATRHSMAHRVAARDMAFGQSRRLYERLFGRINFIENEQEPALAGQFGGPRSAVA